jgi:hypothetical protein
MYIFGLELETFLINNNNEIIIPDPKIHPTDSYIGLLEFRSKPNSNIFNCFGEIESQLQEFTYKNKNLYPLIIANNTFTTTQKQLIRKRTTNQCKSYLNTQNIYGLKPKAIGNKSIASLQINISNQISSEYKQENVTIPAKYGLLDINNIVSSLDNSFKNEIKNQQRQLGWYAIKDQIRLEYRSLPNTIYKMPNFFNTLQDIINTWEK